MRSIKSISVAAVVLVIGWVIFVTASIYNPRQGDVEARTDAVVSLSPPPYRLPLAQELYVNDRAAHLAISYVPVDPAHFTSEWMTEWEAAQRYCHEEVGVVDENISCFTPEEITTRGEAHAIREIAETESWDSITVVTSRHHVFRTRLIFNQCIGDSIDVNVVFPEPDLSIEKSKDSWGEYLLYENGAFIKALYQTTFKC